MLSSSKLAPAARRLGPLAAGTAIVVLATGIGLIRHRNLRRLPALSSAPVTGPAPQEAGKLLFVEAPAAVRPAFEHPREPAPRIGSLALTIAIVLGVVGASLVGTAIAAQRSAPLPPRPLPVAAEIAMAPDVEGWRARISRSAVVAGPTAQPTPRPTPSEWVLPAVKPVALQIPAIGVRSPVHALGQADDGSLETPQPGPRYNHAAWYRHSPTPGSLGPSILLGHVDSAAEGPSVFFNLGSLRAGDRVTVTRADDSVAVFRVDRVRRYAKNNFPADLVYGDIDHAGLRIVTCGGAFDNATGHYLDNVVVFASLVPPPSP